ncbi:MAG: hypothetical protein U9O24_07580 [Campylobacterota bacterium]|nr:hypothetical protein [Campylobacterota bacterium]
MVKIALLSTLLYVASYSQTLYADEKETLEKACLSCHKAQQIPNKLIYRRYLMKYSTTSQMHKVIYSYLKNPTTQQSIMPPQFFLKFPRKEASHLEDVQLKELIREYLDRFDIRGMLILN